MNPSTAGEMMGGSKLRGPGWPPTTHARTWQRNIYVAMDAFEATGQVSVPTECIPSEAHGVRVAARVARDAALFSSSPSVPETSIRALFRGLRGIHTPLPMAPSSIASTWSPGGKNSRGDEYIISTKSSASHASSTLANQDGGRGDIWGEERESARHDVVYASSDGPVEVSIDVVDAFRHVLDGAQV